jgi:glycosyltransferase involved in cell wall biosynthesis
MTKLPITLCISTRNAGEHLVGCIESVRAWVSEITVIDMESSDETLEIARSFGATIVEVRAAGWAEPGRQAGLDAATQPWILVLDADERGGPELQAVAASYVDRDDVAGVWLPRQNFQFGWWVPGAGIWPDWQLRLFRRDRTAWPAVWTHAGPVVAGSCEHAPKRTENAIVHYSYPSIADWIGAVNRYTDHEANRLDGMRRKASVTRLFAVPLLRFGDLYIRRRGYRGGRYGLTVALLSFCYWVLAELKLWERTLDPAGLPAGSVPSSEDGGSPEPSALRWWR